MTTTQEKSEDEYVIAATLDYEDLRIA